MSSPSSTDDDDARQLALVRQVYGPSADIYTDVLHLSPTATSAEIRESFFCLRYDAYRRLESGGESMSPSERLKVQQTMDAIAAGFHIVGDPTRRMLYDKSRRQQQQQQRQQQNQKMTTTTSTTDELGFPVLNPVTGRPVVRHNLPTSPSSSTAKAIATMNLAKGEIASRRSKSVNVAGGINVRSSSLTKSTWTDFDEVEKARGTTVPTTRSKSAHLPPTTKSLRHENYSNADRRSAAPPDMWGKKNTSPTSVITTDMINSSKQASRKGNSSSGNIPTPRRLDDNAVQDDPSGVYDETTSSPSHLDKTDDAIMETNLPVSMKPFSSDDDRLTSRGAASPATFTLASDDTQVNDNTRRAPSPASRMLKNAASRMAAAAAKEEVRRQKKAAIILKKLEEEEEKWTALASKVALRTGADITLSSSTNAARVGGGGMTTLPKDDDRSTDDDNTMDDDDRTNYDDETNTYDGNEETTMGDTTYADDTTMGEDTTYYDDTATMGSATYADDTTIGESTWASDYSDQDHPSSGRHIPRHKQMKGNMPEPILKSTSRGKKVGGKNDDARQVTIHSHRGRGEDYEESCEIFEAGACPSISVIREELNGTYQDLTHTWKQVTSAFQISTDDIDRLADKIRDAKLELGEHYTRQVMDRSTAAGVGAVGGGGETTTSTTKTATTTTPDLTLLQQQKMWQISKKMFT